MSNINEFIKKRPELIWYTKNYENLTADSIVEAVLNYGDWEDVQEMMRILGMDKTTEIFHKSLQKKRNNYNERTKNYFSRYFKKYSHA